MQAWARNETLTITDGSNIKGHNVFTISLLSSGKKTERIQLEICREKKWIMIKGFCSLCSLCAPEQNA